MALTTNLVSYWKFDESSGNAADAVGSNTLTNIATATFAPGKINNAISLNGTTQYFSISDAAQSGLDITSDLSIQFWINFSSFSASTAYVPMGKINFATAGNSRAYAVEVNVTGNNKLDFDISNGTEVRKGVAWTPSTSTFYHIVVVYTATAGSADFYIDSVAQTQQTGFPTSINNSTDAFTIGAAIDGAGLLGPVPGLIDEAAIWSRALTSGEVAQLYNGGAGFQYPFVSGPTNVKTRNGLALASVKAVDGLVTGSIKSLNGLT